MIGRLSRFHFAPTERAHTALVSEGISASEIWITGNTAVDAQRWSCAHKGIGRRIEGGGDLLVSVHRRESWGEQVEQICHAIADVAAAHPELNVLFPVHLNPVVREPVHRILEPRANVRLTAPLDYLAMQQALVDSWLVLTDSGGLQEEAPTYGVPLLVLREETERPEAIEAGCAKLVGTSRPLIVAEVERLWNDVAAYQQMRSAGNPFGEDSASERIVSTFERHLSGKTSDTHVAA